MSREQAERAVQHYFQPGNLTALRELALRRTAQRVDEQMVDYMRAHAIQGPWAAGERVLVCVNEDPSCAAVVRYARRLADRLRAPWTAIHVETSRTQRLGEAERDRIAEACASPSGSAARRSPCPGQDVAEGMLDYARANNFTHIVIAKSRRPRWSEWLRGSATHQLIRQAGDISVHVIAERERRSRRDPDGRRAEAAPSASRRSTPGAYVGGDRLRRRGARGWARCCSSCSASRTSRWSS